jgi:hypothetical protein
MIDVARSARRYCTVAEIYITFRDIFPNLDVPRGVRGPNLVRSTRLVELSSLVSPETLSESTEACHQRPKRPFLGNELINIVSRKALLVFLNGPIIVSRYSSQVRR